MASQGDPLTCPRCLRRFTQNSSLVRHSKRCLQNIQGPSRQKSCRQCASSKVRCDLQHPSCGRCQARSAVCEFPESSSSGVRHVPQIPEPQTQEPQPEADDEQQDTNEYSLMGEDSSTNTTIQTTSFDSLFSQTATTEIDLPPYVPPQLIISRQRRQVLLGTAPGTHSDAVARHTMHFVIRVLKSWPRMMAAHDTSHLPPMIHRLQLADGVPTPLANCYTLVKMWAGHTDGSRGLVENTILQEVQRLLREHHTYSETDILATAQSLLMLLIILLFFDRQLPAVAHPGDARLLIEVWDVKHHLAATGLFLEQESNRILPSWEKWALFSAKRRTILGLHHLEWSWSVLHGYPTMTCFELSPLPAPEARYLWQETNEETWARLYEEWLREWKDGSYKMGEFFDINAGASLDARSEMWLAETDEFGMMLMAEVNATGS